MASLTKRKIIALGANLPSEAGPPLTTLRAAIGELNQADLAVTLVSRLYSTPCFPAGAGPDYVNAAAVLETDITAASLLDRLHLIEAHFGRERKQRWGMRTLDLDLIANEDEVAPDRATVESWIHLAPDAQMSRAPEQMILPHPRLHERAFVLVPMADVAPDWRHPVLGVTVREMLESLPKADRDAVRPLDGPSPFDSGLVKGGLRA